MPDWSSHLPRVGALVASAAIAATAYGVHTGQSDSPLKETGESVAGLPNVSAKSGDGFPLKGRQARAHDVADASSGHAGVGPGFAGSSSDALSQPYSPATVMPDADEVDPDVPRRSPPDGPPQGPGMDPGDDGSLDRELQEVIGGGPPVAPDEQPTDGAPIFQQPADPIEEPVIPRPEPPTPAEDPQPPAENPPPPAADPDTGLDDTPAGSLDQTDLGTPVDETDPAPTPPPPASQSAPQSAPQSPEQSPQSASQSASQVAPQSPEQSPQVASQSAPQSASQSPQVASQSASQVAPQSASQSVPVPASAAPAPG
jgi:hypothetical protein